MFDEYLDFYLSLYHELIKKGIKVVILVSEKRDLKIAEALHAEDSSMMIEYPSSVSRFIDIISRANIIFGTRMHSMIVSYTQLVPIIGFYWQDKIKGFFDTIDCTQNLFYPKTEQIPHIINRYEEINLNINGYKEENIIRLEHIRKRIATDLDNAL